MWVGLAVWISLDPEILMMSGFSCRFFLVAVILASSLSFPASAQSSKDVQGAPIGAPIGAPAAGGIGAGGGGTGGPLRVIPQASWDLLNQMESESKTDFAPCHDGVHLKVPFGAIASFDYEVADPAKLRAAKDPKALLGDQVPAKIKALNGKPVLLVGFMVPIDVDRKGNVTSFALTQNQSFCCYGIPPGLTQLVVVQMEAGKVAPYSYDVPVAVYGTMKVGEDIDDGYILSLYRVTATEVVDVRELMKRGEKAKTAGGQE
jgi:hypothetical protein